MLLYRINRWTNPGVAHKDLGCRRAMTAMSVRWVSREWLERRASIRARDVDSLLESLSEAGVLEVSDHDRAPEETPRRAALSTLRGLLQRVGRHGRERAPTGVLRDLSPWDIQLIVDDLNGILSRGEAARHVLAELSCLEKTLRTRGAAAVDRLPRATLRWALAQLRSLGPCGAQGLLGVLQHRLEAAVRPERGAGALR